MLTGLSIRNIVLIERLDLTFSDGLSVLTGETGAGKSILLDSLSLALGARSEARLLRPGADNGRVTATFELTPGHPLLAVLDEHDLPVEDTLILRRVLSTDGRTRAYVNDEPTSVNLLRRLGDSLIEIQGQFEERGLLNPATHRGLLDAFGALEVQRDKSAAAYRDWRTATAARTEAETEAARAKQDEEYLRHALAELQELGPVAGEEDQLADTRNMLQNAEALISALTDSFAELDGESAAESRLRAALGRLDRIADKAGGRLGPAQAALERAIVETQESMRALRAVADDVQVAGDDLESIEERLFTLRDVARKHGVAVDDLPALCDRIAARVDSIESEADTLDRLRQAESQAREQYVACAEALHEARHAAAARLDAAVTAELPPLKLEKAQFMTVLEALPEDQWGPDGTDRVAFEVCTNPGAPSGPLTKIASGGELSRFMLALKVVLAEVGDTPTLVFDEVDSGIGGATADAVGERLARLAHNVQVLVVTHSPQVAARGDTHLRVEKRSATDLAQTSVDRLVDEARREEVARMLSGRRITDEARAAADRLLEGERV